MESKNRIQLQVVKGKDIFPFTDSLASLRLEIFREYPYLYEGNMEEERKYLKMYYQSKQSLIVLAKDHETIIGVITGLPLLEATDEIKEVFVQNKVAMEGIFYLGEIVLLKKYRKTNIAFRLFKEFENEIKSKKLYQQMAMCEVERPDADTKKPLDYAATNKQSKDFVQHKDLVTSFSWKDIGDSVKTQKKMRFWMKAI